MALNMDVNFQATTNFEHLVDLEVMLSFSCISFSWNLCITWLSFFNAMTFLFKTLWMQWKFVKHSCILVCWSCHKVSSGCIQRIPFLVKVCSWKYHFAMATTNFFFSWASHFQFEGQSNFLSVYQLSVKGESLCDKRSLRSMCQWCKNNHENFFFIFFFFISFTYVCSFQFCGSNLGGPCSC